MLLPNPTKVLIPGAGSYASRRFIDWLTESESDRIQHLIDGYRLDTHGFSVNSIIPVEHPPLSVESTEPVIYDPIPIINWYMKDGLDSTDIRQVQQMIEDPKVESEVKQWLESVNGIEIPPQTPSEAWERQDLTDNYVPTLASVVAKQHGISNSEGIATLRALLDGTFDHQPICSNLGMLQCDNLSSDVGTNIDHVAKVFASNGVPVEEMHLSQRPLEQLDALLLTGKSVCLAVDGRPLWTPLFDHIPETGLPISHVIQVVAKTDDGDYVVLDTRHTLGREIVYSKAQILEAWETTAFRTFVTKNPIPDWKANTEETPTIEPTQNEVSDVDTANPSVFDALIESIETARNEGEDVDVGEDMAAIRAAELMHTADGEELTTIFEPAEHAAPNVHITPETANTEAEAETVDFGVA